MPDQPTTSVLRSVPDWSLVVVADNPQQLGVVTNNRPRGKVLVKTSREDGTFLPADQVVVVVKYPAELAHAALEGQQTAQHDLSVPVYVYDMLRGSDRDRSWSGNPAMRAIMSGVMACGVRRRGLLDKDRVLVLERCNRSYELSDNGGEIDIYRDSQHLISIPLTRWSTALRVDTVVYRIMCVLMGGVIDYDHDPLRPGESVAETNED